MNENSGCAFQKSIFVGVQVSGVYLSMETSVGNKKTRGKLEQESIFVGVQVSGVYLSTGDTVVNRKAYLWEFEYLVAY